MRWFIVLLVVFVVGFVVMTANPPPYTEAKEAVKAQLRDPGSAQFGTITFHNRTAPKSGAAVVVACGTVNAKNGFGGYVGEKRFFAYPKAGMAMIDDGSTTYSDLWALNCT